MNTLIRHIEYLIAHRDCVIIPELGALLASRIEAEYNAEQHILTPPYRQFTFNSSLRHNDGLLATSVQRADGISYEAAMRLISQAVESMKTQLRANGEMAIGHIGVLKRDASSNAFYLETHADDNVEMPASADTLWLKTLELKPTRQAENANIIEAPIKRGRFNTLKRIGRAAASVAILLGIGFVASTPVPIDDAVKASFAPDVYKVQPQALVPQDEVTTPLNITLPLTTDGVIEATPRLKSTDPLYYVVVASLSNAADAALYVSQHPDEDLKTIKLGRIYTIYSSVHTDVYEAYRASYKADRTHPGAWVFKK